MSRQTGQSSYYVDGYSSCDRQLIVACSIIGGSSVGFKVSLRKVPVLTQEQRASRDQPTLPDINGYTSHAFYQALLAMTPAHRKKKCDTNPRETQVIEVMRHSGGVQSPNIPPVKVLSCASVKYGLDTYSIEVMAASLERF